MLRPLVGLLITVFLTGCATSLDRSEFAKIKRMGVVSTLGDKFHGISIGTTVFNNEYFEGDVADWHVDAEIESELIGFLKANTTLSVERFHPDGTNDPKSMEDTERLSASAAKQGFDRLLVARPAVVDDTHLKPGYGIFERTMFGSPSRRCVYMSYVLEVLDTTTHKQVAWQWADGAGSPCLQGMQQGVAFKTRLADYSDEEQAYLKDRLTVQIGYSVQSGLRELGFLAAGTANK